MALLVTASLNLPNRWARKHSRHIPAPPDAATAGPPPSHLPHVVAAIESRAILSAGASSSAPAGEPEEEQCGPQPAPPQAETEAVAMAGAGLSRRVRTGTAAGGAWV